jgi:hypothetical protein
MGEMVLKEPYFVAEADAAHQKNAKLNRSADTLCYICGTIQMLHHFHCSHRTFVPRNTSSIPIGMSAGSTIAKLPNFVVSSEQYSVMIHLS